MKEGALLAGRYRLDQELGRGGMAVAYAATDTVRGVTLAVKRLLPGALSAGDDVTRLFEQEFHTLQQLRHPRVVQAYDFGYEDDGRAFYTMEWLPGGDLRELSPLPYRQACARLSDICSALSLLHSRRLLHRDVTARNVRCASEGHAKLIDFGAVVPFGAAPRLIGTPPFCPPEAVTGQELDGRTDLFALGATLYFALTGRNAYPARTFELLRKQWSNPPPPPSHYCPDLPEALDRLVMSLLALDRDARPASAAEVMERLCVLAELDMSEQVVVQQAYLTTPKLVGREEPLQQARELIKRVRRGRGAAMWVRGPEGSGRSRFAASCVLEGKLAGLVVVRADATHALGDFGVAHALVEQVCENLPALAARVPPLRDDGADRDAAHLAALRDLMLSAARRHPLMLVVDDADRIDDRSAALLGLLADGTRQDRVVVLATTAGDAAEAPASLGFFQKAATVVSLHALSQAESRALLQSIFGDVANLGLIADRLYTLSGGMPAALMQLAQHLLDRGLVRYEAGGWTLPACLEPGDLPSSVQAMLQARLAAIGPRERALASALALAPAGGLQVDALAQLAASDDTSAVLRSLDVLVEREIATVAGIRYRLSSASYGALLLAGLSESEAQSLHGRMADVIAARTPDSWHVVRHLVLARRLDDALDVFLSRARQDLHLDIAEIAARARELTPDWLVHMRTLVAHAGAPGRPALHRDLAQGILLGLGALRSDAERSDVEAVLAQLEHDCGCDIYERLDPALAPQERLTQALTQAQARYDATPEALRVRAPAEALPELGRAVMRAIGVLGSRFEYDFFAGLTALEPFVPLSPALQVLQWNVEATRALAQGRYHAAHEKTEAILARMAEPDRADLDPVSHRYMGLALELSSQLQQLTFGAQLDSQRLANLDGDPLFAVSAHQVRMFAALSKGDASGADRHRRQAELLQLQDNPPQMFGDWCLALEVLVYAFAGDLARLKQTIVALEAVAERIPGYRPILHHAKGSYQALRGADAQALQEAERGLSLVRPGEHPFYIWLAANEVTALLSLDRKSDALARGAQHLAGVRPHDPGPVLNALLEAVALAHAQAEEYPRARALADEAIGLLQDFGAAGLVMGSAYEARAYVAIAEGDHVGFEHHARKCTQIYRAARNPLLAARHARLMETARTRLQVADDLAVASVVPAEDTHQEATSIAHGSDPVQRFRAALRKLLRASGSDAGFLYVMEGSGPRLVAQVGALQPVANMDTLVANYVEQETADLETVLDSAASTPSVLSTLGAQVITVTLSHDSARGTEITGVALLRRAVEVSHPEPPLVSSISLALQQAGVSGVLAG
ncbi:MAG: protein kinase [Myxococcales bacterium]|nr:protein kinase [Myxococcales bacterium]